MEVDKIPLNGPKETKTLRAQISEPEAAAALDHERGSAEGKRPYSEAVKLFTYEGGGLSASTRGY